MRLAGMYLTDRQAGVPDALSAARSEDARKWGMLVSYAILILSIILAFTVGLIIGAFFSVFILATLPLFIIYGTIVLIILVVAIFLCCRCPRR